MFTPSRRRSHRVSGTVDNEEEFDWESDDEETTTSTAKTRSQAQPTQPEKSEGEHDEETPTTKLSTTSTPVHVSPRHSESEDGSYDVVSSQVSNNGEGKEEDLGASRDTAKPEPGIKETDEEEEDSDWE